MSQFDDQLSNNDNDASRNGEAVVAFFDMDKTILSVNSAKLWAVYMWRSGELKTRHLVKSMSWLMRYRLALVDIERVTEEVSEHIIGKDEAQMREVVRQWYQAEVRQFIIPGVVEKIREHQAQNHHVVLLTAASPYISAPLCEELGLDDFLCTRFEIESGRFTGQLVKPLCYGAGKVHWADQWCEAHGARLQDAYFYTDSFTDLPMLEQVGRAVAVNPDPRLRRWATRCQVPILDYGA